MEGTQEDEEALPQAREQTAGGKLSGGSAEAAADQSETEEAALQ